MFYILPLERNKKLILKHYLTLFNISNHIKLCKMDVSDNYLRKQIINIGCYLEGEFTLKSGEQSTYYVDLRKIISHPELVTDVCNYIYHMYIKDIIRYDNFGQNLHKNEQKSTIRIMGVPYGAMAYASVISTMFNIPLIIMRKEQKEYGTKKLIDGEYNECDRIIVIEDVVTSGGSVKDSIQKLSNNKLITIGVVALFDRGGIHHLCSDKTICMDRSTHSVHCPKFAYSLFNHNDFKLSVTDIINKMIQHNESRLVFSNDITDKKLFLDVMNSVENISFLKIHSDIIKGFDDEFISQLLELKRSMGFLIIEDRKFADIGSIVKQQIQHNKIHKWADLVTVHGIAGESTLQGIIEMDMDMLLIGQMSSKDNLITTEYTNDIVSLAQKYKSHVTGFISQQSLSKDFLTFTPGVNIDITHDNLGQTYNTPESLYKTGTDFFIVGRGIYNSSNPSISTDKYNEVIDEAINS